MKAILEFDIDNFEDEISHLIAIKSKDYILALWRLDGLLYKRDSIDRKAFKEIVEELDIDVNLLP